MDPIDTDIRAAIGALWAAPPGAAELARARLLLLDTIGCAIAGLREPQVQAYAQAWRAPGPVRLPGLDDGLSTLAFAHVFAAASCWHEACEGLAEAHGRPGLHAIPAVLGPALAERLPLGALLAAIVAGYEIGGRLGAVCRIRPGMHVDGAWGAFAAAAALARLRGLDPTSAAAAIDHVCTTRSPPGRWRATPMWVTAWRWESRPSRRPRPAWAGRPAAWPSWPAC
jgi:2-methylcitrate dehydratase PrpD